MTNYSKPQRNYENNINNDIFIGNIKLGGSFIDIFFGKNCGLNDDHKKTILLYFWESRDLIDVKYENNKFKVSFKNDLLDPITVLHDPERNESFKVYCNFGSLLNLQAHTFKHCIADHWKNRGSAPDFIEENEEFFKEFWCKFTNVNCKFFSDIKLSDIDTCEKAKVKFKTLENESDNRSIENIKNRKTSKLATRNWCMDCINKHNGPDTFLKCWKLFSDNSIHKSYLKRIRACIVKTIQDQKNIEFYKGNRTNGTPERRHIHYRKDGNLHIASYALDYESNRKGHVFYLVFKKYGRNGYHMKTAYPLKISEKPVTKIYSHAKNKLGNETILNCCHVSNWTGIKKMLSQK